AGLTPGGVAMSVSPWSSPPAPHAGRRGLSFVDRAAVPPRGHVARGPCAAVGRASVRITRSRDALPGPTLSFARLGLRRAPMSLPPAEAPLAAATDEYNDDAECCLTRPRERRKVIRSPSFLPTVP